MLGGKKQNFVALLVVAMLAGFLPATFSQTANAQQANSIQMLHVVPAGTTPTANIATTAPETVAAVQRFLAVDVGRTLRVTPGVTQVQVTNGGLTSVVNQLEAQGFNDTNTIYLVFADMQGDLGCGVTSPRTVNRPAYPILWMPACDIYPGSGPQTFPFNATYLVLHELLHALGAVPRCAPNADGTGHVTDSASDMLWALGGRDWDNLTVDFGRDDYYGHSNTGCPDIADSPYWLDAAPPTPTPPSLPVEADECAPSRITIDMNTNGGDGRGTPGPDVILGTPGTDYIYSGDGNDVICAGLGVDIVFAGAGRDIVFGGGGTDYMWAGGADDTVIAGSGSDRVYGGSGNDLILGQGGQDFLWGEAGNDDIQGNHQSDLIYGGPGNDTLRGAGGKDKLYGEGGNDLLFGGNNTDYLNGGQGFDEANGQNGKDNPVVADLSGCIAEVQVSC